ncbi:AAA family ATPase [Aestuariivivens sediminis]|uniref:AAA family ATPase n=1 Tax=Aestuariivivens sediminis TaxID=2913557 RepID=UPI001F56CDA2|nr:AAA family ATPase [Aestuariivivens sediminis]
MKLIDEELVKPEVTKLPSDDKKHPFVGKRLSEIINQGLPPIKKLIGELILPEELTIIFGDSSLGKSAWAYSLAKSIHRGCSLNMGNGVFFENECGPIPVIYFDFELSDRQIVSRNEFVEDKEDIHIFKLERGEVIESDPKECFYQLKMAADGIEAKCIVIDNLTAISNDLEKGENAKKFMRAAINLVKDEGYTVIILTHTPKLKNFEPLNLKHIKGSSTIGQLADNVIGFAQVNTTNEGEAYIKQIKNRNYRVSYGANKSIHTRIEVNNGVLKHEALGFSNEMDLLFGGSGIATDKAPDREFYAMAQIYYGSSRKAHEKLKEVGLSLSHTAINGHYQELKQIFPDKVSAYEQMDKNELKAQLDLKSPKEDVFLPDADDHLKLNEIPF